MNKSPVTAIIVGAGHRAMVYSKLALTNPELLKIVGVADPNPVRRKHCMEKFGFSEDMCFENAQELAKKGKLADTIINGTMDEQHIETSIPLLNAGYDMLLEKPFAVNEEVSSLKPTAFAPVTVQSAEYIGDSHQMSFFVADQHFSQALCKQRRAFLEADGFGGACQ